VANPGIAEGELGHTARSAEGPGRSHPSSVRAFGLRESIWEMWCLPHQRRGNKTVLGGEAAIKKHLDSEG